VVTVNYLCKSFEHAQAGHGALRPPICVDHFNIVQVYTIISQSVLSSVLCEVSVIIIFRYLQQ